MTLHNNNDKYGLCNINNVQTAQFTPRRGRAAAARPARIRTTRHRRCPGSCWARMARPTRTGARSCSRCYRRKISEQKYQFKYKRENVNGKY